MTVNKTSNVPVSSWVHILGAGQQSLESIQGCCIPGCIHCVAAAMEALLLLPLANSNPHDMLSTLWTFLKTDK